MKHITSEERQTIEYLLSQNLSPTTIATQLGRYQSTFTREIKSNGDHRNGEYRNDLAERKAQDRQKFKTKRRDYTLAIEVYIERELAKWDSPEQIVGKEVQRRISAVKSVMQQVLISVLES